MKGTILVPAALTSLLVTGAVSGKAPSKPQPAPPSSSNHAPAPSDGSAVKSLGPELTRLYALMGGRYQVAGEILTGESKRKLGVYSGPSETVPALGGKYLRGTRFLAMPQGAIADSETLTTYDPSLGKYRQWMFSSRVKGPVEFTGTFEGRTFVAKSVDGKMTFTIKRKSATQVEGTSELVGRDGSKIIQNYVATLKR